MAGRRARPTDGQVDDVPEKHRKLPDTADDAEEPAEEAEVEEEDEEDEEEGEIEIDEDEDPVELLKAQGVSEDVAKRMLENAEGDVDAAVMLIVEHQELEKEEKDLAKVMEESLQEAEAESEKKRELDEERKKTSPAEFFLGCSFLEHLGEDVSTELLSSDAKDDVIAILDLERKCRQWYRARSGDIAEYFSRIAVKAVANVEFEETDVSGEQGNIKASSMETVHSLLVAHLSDLQDAVLTMPNTPGTVPDIFSPIDVELCVETVDLT